MTRQQIIKCLPGGLFVLGLAGIFVSEFAVAKSVIKAEKILKEECTVLKPGEDPKAVAPVYHTEPNGIQISQTIVTTDTTLEYLGELFKATWKCFIFPTVTTLVTVGAFVGSKHFTTKQLTALSAAVMGAGGLVTRYRDEIADLYGNDILSDIDRKVAEKEIAHAKPPVITTSHLLTTEVFDAEKGDEECTFFDPFTGVKFTTTRLAAMGAKYYLNRNYALGGAVALEMFYNFLGVELPSEYRDCHWDVSEMEDDGYMWIDIDFVKSKEPDPDTGLPYYIIEYSYDPGEIEESFYPSGNPINYYGSHTVKEA